MPADATMSTTLRDGLSPSGFPWLFTGRSGATSGVFREIWVSDAVIPDPVPEPSTVCLFCVGVFGVFAYARRQRHHPRL